jgi:hypothetical protein
LTDGQLSLDPFVDLSFGELGGHANGVLDGVGVGAAVRDDANALDAQQRSAAVFGIIHALLEFVEGGARQQGADLARDGGFQRLAQHLVHHFHQAFADLQRHVADEAVADDDVGVAGINIAAFHVADEMNGERFEQRRGGARELVAFVLFFADGEQPHARPMGVKDDARVDVAHDGELRQHARRTIDVGAHVDHHTGVPLRWETPTPEPADPRPGACLAPVLTVAITAPVFPAETKPSAAPSRTRRAATRMELSRLLRMALPALSSMVMLLAGVLNFDGQIGNVFVLVELRATTSCLPTRMTRTPSERAARMAPSTSAFGASSPPIASTAMVTMELTISGALFFRDFDHFAALVAAAMRTGAVRKLRFVAIGALGVAEHAQMVVSPARGGALLGVSSFWIRHLVVL